MHVKVTADMVGVFNSLHAVNGAFARREMYGMCISTTELPTLKCVSNHGGERKKIASEDKVSLHKLFYKGPKVIAHSKEPFHWYNNYKLCPCLTGSVLHVGYFIAHFCKEKMPLFHL